MANIKVLVAKPGLDGHDRGAEVFTPGTPTGKVVDFINANVK